VTDIVTRVTFDIERVMIVAELTPVLFVSVYARECSRIELHMKPSLK